MRKTGIERAKQRAKDRLSNWDDKVPAWILQYVTTMIVESPNASFDFVKEKARLNDEQLYNCLHELCFSDIIELKTKYFKDGWKVLINKKDLEEMKEDKVLFFDEDDWN